MSDSVTLTGNSRPWGGQVTGDCGPYTDRQWQQMYRTIFDGQGNRGPLLTPADDFLVHEDTPNAMTVEVDAGTAFVDGVWASSPATVTLTVAANATGMTRYDLVFLHWTAATQVTNVRIVDGTAVNCPAAVAPAANAIATYQITNVEWAVPLACIAVPNGAAAITNAMITDMREFCRYRFSPESLGDTTHITTDATTHLLEIAAGGVGVAEINAAIAGAGLTGGGGAALSVVGATLAGAGLTSPGGAVVDVNADGTTIEVVADQVRIAATAAGNGLTGGGGAALAANVDATTIVIVGDILQVGTITNANIANRTRACFIGANALHASVANPPTWGAIAGQPVPAEGWLAALNDDDYSIGHWHVPADFVAGNVTVRIVWTHAAAGDTVCRLRFDYINAMASGGSLVGGTTSITQDTNALIADANKRMCTNLSTTIAMVADDYLDFYVGRNGNHANDTLASDMVLLGVEFQYTADM